MVKVVTIFRIDTHYQEWMPKMLSLAVSILFFVFFTAVLRENICSKSKDRSIP